MAKTTTKSIVLATDAQANALAALADAQAQQVVAEHAGLNNVAVMNGMFATMEAMAGIIIQTAAGQIQTTQ
jgi:hypothetical protein